VQIKKEKTRAAIRAQGRAEGIFALLLLIAPSLFREKS
jgi:hypothetical protein